MSEPDDFAIGLTLDEAIVLVDVLQFYIGLCDDVEWIEEKDIADVEKHKAFCQSIKDKLEEVLNNA